MYLNDTAVPKIFSVIAMNCIITSKICPYNTDKKYEAAENSLSHNILIFLGGFTNDFRKSKSDFKRTV